jgi:AGZA family xanthine/uracil permease-like MFS transporter
LDCRSWKVVVDDPVTLVKLGDLSNPIVLLGCATFIAIIVMEKMKIKGNIIIGILVFSIISWAAGLANFNGLVSSPPPMTYLFEFDLSGSTDCRNVYSNIYFIIH